MSDQTFADLVRHAEGEEPTAAELDRMRTFVIESIDRPRVDHLDIAVLPSDDPHHEGSAMNRNRITATLLAVAAAALLIVGIAVLASRSDGDGDIVETTTPTPAPTTTAEPEPTPAPTPTPPEVDEDSAPPAPAGTVPLDDITAVPIRLDAATYWTDTLGTELVLDVGERWTAHRHADGRLVLGDAFTQGPGDNDLTFIRASRLADPTRPTRLSGDWLWWPADDIDAWIEAAAPGIDISGVRDVEVGGYPATTFDVVLNPDEIDCVSQGCIRFATNDVTYALLGLSDAYRIWFVEQGEFEPLVIVAAADRSPDDFLTDVEDLLAGIELGEAQPMPVTN